MYLNTFSLHLQFALLNQMNKYAVLSCVHMIALQLQFIL